MSNKSINKINELKSQEDHLEKRENLKFTSEAEVQKEEEDISNKNLSKIVKINTLTDTNSKESGYKNKININENKILMKKRANKADFFNKKFYKKRKTKKIRDNESEYKKSETEEDSEESEKIETKEQINDSFDNKDLIPLKSIQEYYNEKKSIWENEKNNNNFNLEEFCKDVEIFDEANYQYSIKLVKSNMQKFYEFYSKYQFTLKLSQRKNIQIFFEKNENLPLILKYNIISSETISLRINLLKLCESIIKINLSSDINQIVSNLKNCFILHKFYSTINFEYILPIKYANYDCKMCKLGIEISKLFFGISIENEKILSNSEKFEIKEKLLEFLKLEKFLSKSNLYDDNEFFNTFDFIINTLFIYFDSNEDFRNTNLLNDIINCCLPFELEIAKKILGEIKIRNTCIEIMICEKDLEINLIDYNIENLTENSMIKLSYIHKNIKIGIKDVNWNLTAETFIKYFKTQYFILCFRFSVIPRINFLNINEEIKKNYSNLYKKIIQSKIMEKMMNIDNEAKIFDYPFKNNEILKEVEDNCLLVPFPAEKYYGFTDKISFRIYLNSFINVQQFQTIITDVDNITKSKSHEIKHLSRVYYHLFNRSISLWTPKVELTSKSPLLKEKYKYIEIKRKLFNDILEKRVIFPEQTKTLDYGDILEFAFNGNRQNIFFPNNSIFCLSENTWDLPIEKFEKKYFSTCEIKNFTLRNYKDKKFICSLFKYFNFQTNLLLVNNAITSKRVSKSNIISKEEKIIINECIVKEKASHRTIKKFNYGE